MAIDLSGLPLALDGEADPAALRRRAGARLAATEAWLDEDGEAVDRIAADHRDLAPDLDPLREDLARRRDGAADATRHEEARSAIGATLGRLATGAAEAGEPARRHSHGALARLALQEHAEAGLIDPGEAEAFAGDYDARLAAADAEKLARTDPALARRLLADRSLFPGLLPEQRERLARAAEARLAAVPDDEAASAERTAAIGAGSTLTTAARNRADLRRRLTAGEAGLADIDAAEAAGEIDARGAGALRQGFTAAREKAKQEADGIRRVEARLVAGGRLDPASGEDRAALDTHYLNTRKGWDEAGLAPEEVRAELVDYILDAGCFPDAVRRRIGRIFRVGTPQERWEAADLIRTMEEGSRGLLDQLDPDDVGEALGIAALEKAGWPAADAVARYGLLVSGEAKDPAAARDRVVVERASADSESARGSSGGASLHEKTRDQRASESGDLADDPLVQSLLRQFGAEEGQGEPAPPLRVANARGVKLLLETIFRLIPGVVLEEGQRREQERKAGEQKDKQSSGNSSSPTATQDGEPDKRVDIMTPKKEDQLLPGAEPIVVEPQVEELIPVEVPSEIEGYKPADVMEEDFIEIIPIESGNRFPNYVEANRGGPRTVDLNSTWGRISNDVAIEEGLPARHVAGGNSGSGEPLLEKYLSGGVPGSTKDGSFVDMAIYDPITQRWIYMNTSDVRKSGLFASQEILQRNKLLLNKKTGDIIILSPKPPAGYVIDEVGAKEFLRPLIREISLPYDPERFETHRAFRYNPKLLPKWIGLKRGY